MMNIVFWCYLSVRVVQTPPSFSCRGLGHKLEPLTPSRIAALCQNLHQGIQIPVKPKFILCFHLPNHFDGDKDYYLYYQTTPLIPRVPKQYRLWG